MASEAQIVANRLNAAKSTGPRTAEGKAVVSQNAVTHGLLARQAVVGGEDPGEFEFYRDQMVGELAPVGAMESMLAERVVSLSWRLRRAERVQNEAFDVMSAKDREGPFTRLAQSLLPRGADGREGDPGDGEPALGRVVVNDFSHARVLDRLLMYERRMENSLFKTMGELQRLRLLRELDGPLEKPTPKPASPRGDDLPRETEPIARDRNAESPARRETPACYAKQSQFEPGQMGANPFSRKDYENEPRPGLQENKAKQTQFQAPTPKSSARAKGCRANVHEQELQDSTRIRSISSA